MSKKTKRQSRKEVSVPAARTATYDKPQEFNPDYSPVIKDLRRIGTLAGIFVTFLIVLSFFLR